MNVPAFVLLGFAGGTDAVRKHWCLSLEPHPDGARLALGMAGGCTSGKRTVSARYARSHELRGEPADLRRPRRGFDGHWLAKPISRCTFCRSSTCSDWTDSGPHCSTTYECMGSAAFRPVLCPNRLHHVDRYHHCPVDDTVTEPSASRD
jgi:hypothetical protein